MIPAKNNCPCGLPASYEACCGKPHRGEAAPTAERLMRSRFAAFVLHDEAYLLRSWHPSTRPPSITFDAPLHYTRLEILSTTDGSPFHAEGTVEFRAHFTDGGEPGSFRELSRFVRHKGAWVYLDGKVLPS